jgi:uncharacterized membrane protein
MIKNVRSLIYKPFSLLYMGFLFFLLFTLASWFLSFFRGLLVEAVGIPQEYFWAVILLSLVGSMINLTWSRWTASGSNGWCQMWVWTGSVPYSW